MKKSLAACVAFAAFGVAQATANDVPLDFLTPGKRYLAQLYQDAPDADYRTNPLVYDYRAHRHTAADRLALALAPGGSAAIRFRALDNEEVEPKVIRRTAAVRR
jgi:alpha-glucosidase